MKKFLHYFLIVLFAFAAGFLFGFKILIFFDDILSNGVEKGASEFFDSPSSSLKSGENFINTGKNIFSQ